MALPQNWQAIVSFLEAHGYSKVAAAGIAGNIMGESGGNPESVGSGGGGLIGFTPLPAGYVTHNVQRDLKFQLNQILAYNRKWSQFLPELNHAKSPQEAARIYMTEFERPANLSSLPLRQSAAADVFKHDNGQVSTTAASSGSGSPLSLNPVPWLLNALGAKDLTDILERGALILLGAVLIIFGIISLSGGKKSPVVQGAGSAIDNKSFFKKDYAEDTPEGRRAMRNAGELPEEGGDESKGFANRNRTAEGKPKPPSEADKAAEQQQAETGQERARRIANPPMTEEQRNEQVPF